MKKMLTLLLAALMIFSMAACGNTNNNDTTTAPSTTTTPSTTAPETTAPTTNEPVVIEPDAQAGTMGNILWNAFQDALTENPEITMEELANTLVTNSTIQFMGMALPVEVGTEYFAGFNNYQITGYESAATFAPMIGSIAFVGYVFDLAEGTDAGEFIKALTDNCDPSWNICVTAKQTVAGAVGDKVFFVMCPGNDE